MTTLKLTKKYKSYPEYKDSGVEWIGKLPVQWEAQKIQRLYSRVKRSGHSDEELLSVYRDYGVIRKGSRNDNFNRASEDLSTYQLVLPGDLVINKMKAWQGSLGVSSHKGLVSPAYYTAKPLSKLSSRFLHYLLRSDSYIAVYKARSGGIRNNQWDLDYDQFRKIDAILPPLAEQAKIAAFLDEKTTLIDAVIEKKQKLIELLKERRAASLEAMLQANGESVKIKFVAMLNAPVANSTVGPKDNVAFVPMEAISEEGEFTYQVRKYEDVSSGFSHFAEGDVLIAKITPCFENGKGGVVKDIPGGTGYGTTEFVVLRPSQRVIAEYLYMLTHCRLFRSKGESEMKGVAGQRRLTAQFVKNYEFRLPTISKQKLIIDEYGQMGGLSDEAVSKIMSSIEILQEVKSSLVSQAVTGKIEI